MKSHIILAATASALLFCLPNASAQTQKYVVIENVPAAPNQAEVGGQAAIPLDGTDAEIDAAGNIVVKCNLGTEGALPGQCSNIGTGGGNLPNAPSLALAAPTVPVTAVGSKLTWTTNGAAFCHGISAAPVTPPTAPAVAGWVKEWPAASGSSGFSLNQVLSALADGTTATYDFKMRCYSSATGVSSNGTPIIAYVESTKTVELNKPTGGGGSPTGDWCDAYLATLSPAERDHFDLYRADNRGFSRVAKTFQAQTGLVLGQDTGPVGPLIAPVLPGKQTAKEYLALSFSLPQTGGTGKFSLDFQYKHGSGGTKVHNIITAISPCQGDFRPMVHPNAPLGSYLAAACRTPYANAAIGVTGRRNDLGGGCQIPAGSTMYINVSLRNLYDLGETAATPGPTYFCDANYCGAGTDVSN